MTNSRPFAKSLSNRASRRNESGAPDGDHVDVLVVGGGVHGVGTFRELALNGVSTLLVERGDYCGGASGASSRMAHGGLRYLENGEIGLVRESVRERNRLMRNAPHLTGPLEIVIPVGSILGGLGQSALSILGVRRRGSAPGLAVLKCALAAYDVFDRSHQAMPKHFTAPDRRFLPAGLAARFRASAHYYDGLIERPEGVVLELLREGLQQPGCAALNYAHVSAAGDGAFIVRQSGAGTEMRVRPRLVVNAAGAWIDRVNATLLGLPTRHVSGAKGAHLVVRHNELRRRMAGRAFYFEDGEGRMIISYPLAQTILVGTTEIPIDDPDSVTIEQTERAYLLNKLNTLFSDISVSESHVVAHTMGIRPLRNSGSTSAYRASRDHVLTTDRTAWGTPVFSMVGGKWTTFRAFCELTTDKVLFELGLPRAVSTAERPLPGAVDWPTDAAKARALVVEIGEHVGEQRAKAWIARYAMLARELARYAGLSDSPLRHAPEYCEREMAWLIETQHARTVEDLTHRRTTLHVDGCVTPELEAELASVLERTRTHQDGVKGATPARAAS